LKGTLKTGGLFYLRLSIFYIGSKNLINPDSVASPFVVLLLTSSSNDKKTASELQPILIHNYLKPSSLGSYGKNLSSFILGVTPGTVVISIL